MSGEEQHFKGDTTSKEVYRILKEVGYNLVSDTLPFDCHFRSQHRGGRTHVLDLLFEFTDIGNDTKLVMIESKSNTRTRRQLEREAEKLVKKIICYDRGRNRIVPYPNIENGIVVNCDGIRSDVLLDLKTKRLELFDDSKVLIYWITADRYRLLKGLYNFKRKHHDYGTFYLTRKLNPASIHDQRNETGLRWLTGENRTYAIHFADNHGTIGIFDFSRQKYSVPDWTSDANDASLLRWKIERIDSMMGFTSDLIDNLRAFDEPIRLVDHRNKVSFFCPAENYPLEHERNDCDN